MFIVAVVVVAAAAVAAVAVAVAVVINNSWDSFSSDSPVGCLSLCG